MDEKTFTIAGTSQVDGRNTYRFANGSLTRRMATLKRHGHTKVNLLELPREMDVEGAVAYLRRKGIKAEMPPRGRRPAEVVVETRVRKRA